MIRTAFVTGASGFVGSHLVAELRRRGVRVRALVHDAQVQTEVDYVRGDLTSDCASLEDHMRGYESVFHCAGEVGDRVTWGAAHALNVEGTRRVARAARRAGARTFVHVSSVAVYGFDAGHFDETRVCTFVGEPYIDSKLGGEQACISELHGSPTTLRIMRPGVIYGPGDTGMLPRLGELLAGRVPMIGRGNNAVGLVHVSDVVRAMLAAAEYSGSGTTFNLIGPDDVSWTELIALVGRRLNTPRPMRMPVAIAMFLAHAMVLLQRIGVLASPPLNPFLVKFLSQPRTYEGKRARTELLAPMVGVHAGLSEALRDLSADGGPHPLQTLKVIG